MESPEGSPAPGKVLVPGSTVKAICPERVVREFHSWRCCSRPSPVTFLCPDRPSGHSQECDALRASFVRWTHRVRNPSRCLFVARLVRSARMPGKGSARMPGYPQFLGCPVKTCPVTPRILSTTQSFKHSQGRVLCVFWDLLRLLSWKTNAPISRQPAKCAMTSPWEQSSARNAPLCTQAILMAHFAGQREIGVKSPMRAASVDPKNTQHPTRP